MSRTTMRWMTIAFAAHLGCGGAEAPPSAPATSKAKSALEAGPAVWVEQQQLVIPQGQTGGNFGSALAVSGDTAFIGAPAGWGGAGAVFVFARTGATWAFQQKLEASNRASTASFGRALSVSKDTLVVGSESLSTVDGLHYDAGAYVFVRTGATWTEQQIVRPAGGMGPFEPIAVSDDTIVVGGSSEASSGQPGAAYVFVRSQGTWTLQQRLTASIHWAGDRFGTELAISGDTLIVGDPYQQLANGGAYVFVRNGTTWTEQQKIVVSAASSKFGSAVALSEDTALVGAPDSYQGSAYVFARTGGAWAQQQRLVGSDFEPQDDFGSRVALSGDTAVVGTAAKGNGRGEAYVFTRSGSAWVEQQALVASDGLANDNFGWSVGISGGTMVVGAPAKNAGQGAAYVFVGPSSTACASASECDAGDGGGGDAAVGDAVVSDAAVHDAGVGDATIPDAAVGDAAGCNSTECAPSFSSPAELGGGCRVANTGSGDRHGWLAVIGLASWLLRRRTARRAA
jgi:hypothetical protein